MLSRARRIFLVVALCSAAASRLACAEDSGLEYQVKSAFLFNFAKFVEWPAGAFAKDSAPLVIGILGDDPFGETLDNAVRDKQANNRPIVVKRFKRLEDVKDTHILFISRSESTRVPRILEKLKGTNVLAVGESAGFLNDGGMIQFVIRDERVCLDVNPDAAEREKLKISSKLLRLATIVKVKEK